MSEWVPAARLSDLARRRKLLVTVAGEPVALFLVDGQVHALHDVCIHRQRSLSRGAVLHGRIICPGHQWAFEPATGWVEDQQRCQPTYDVRVENDTVYVDPTRRVRFPQASGAADAE